MERQPVAQDYVIAVSIKAVDDLMVAPDPG